jgi:ketosteroid isomerase-like protein
VETILIDPGVENENMKNKIIVFAIGLTAFAGLTVRAFPALSGFGAPAQSADREVDRREIIRAYESARAAHFHHDAAAFLANNDISWYLVVDGTVALRTTAAVKPGVQEYFDSVKFADITDLDPPHVEVSSDGTMAWLLGHVRVRGTQREAKGAEVPLAFDAAWIDVWQKKASGWRIVARANTERDNSPLSLVKTPRSRATFGISNLPTQPSRLSQPGLGTGESATVLHGANSMRMEF